MEGLSQLRDNAIEIALTADETDKRDEARGVVRICRDIIGVAEEIESFHRAIKEN